MLQLSTFDWSIIAAFFLISLSIGVVVARQSGKSSAEFFLSGRNMPWWLLGVSMVATTFSADTPNLVTDIVRKNGVSGNWVWWAFCLTGMLTVFVYAKLWRRSRIVTDLEFYELRYSGKEAAFLRLFRSIYLGVFFNVMIMATVTLAAIKIGSILLGLSAVETVVYSSVIIVLYTSLGGLRGVILTDFFQFMMAMLGTVLAAYYLIDLPQIDGLANLMNHDVVQAKSSFFPDFSDPAAYIPLFLMPIAVQWWSVWYPGAEPGGGGYIVQRMLSAKDEENAVKATLFFNIAHYALRPWPWIIIALGSLLVFPDLESIRLAFPNVDPALVNDDLAYPAMLSYLPSGLLGLVIAALIAAFMSTISTHLNWGSSYIVNDFYSRFINPEASEKTLVNVGRLSTVILMVLAAFFALALTNALQAFNILLQIGAGTGLIFILRWFWWRINAYTEIIAMIASFIIAIVLETFFKESIESHWRLLIGVTLTTIIWLVTTFLTKPTDQKTLLSFFNLVRPHAMGWQPVINQAKQDGTRLETKEDSSLANEILCMVLACALVYGILFGTGMLVYQKFMMGFVILGLAGLAGVLLMRYWRKLRYMEE